MTSHSRVRFLDADTLAVVERYRALQAAGLSAHEAEAHAFGELAAVPNSASPADLYERFLRACRPAERRQHGVYFTPPAVVHAQVQLVHALLQERLGCPDGFGNSRLAVIDPATGSGAYPMAIRQLAGADVTQRMWLFETQPGAAALARAHGLSVHESDALARKLELDAPVVVCIGNPPYRRRTATRAAKELVSDFAEAMDGVHRKNLYNDYVYFWRWALRTVCEVRGGAGIVCFVSAASYLRGPAFGGMRRKLRELLDELWLIDLEGDHLAARATHSVFPIRTPVAIALGVRYGQTVMRAPASVHFTRLGGSSAQKLERLEALRVLTDVEWQPAPLGWSDVLSSVRRTRYSEWPALTEIFPLQLSGAQLKRTWPIGVTPEVLRQRWRQLVAFAPYDRRAAFGPTRDRDVTSSPHDLIDATRRLTPLREVEADAPCPEPVRYAYRAFDRQWLLPDARLGDFLRPALWHRSGPRQVFLTTMLTNVLGPGPAAVATALVPDLDHFRGSFGARGVIPLWCDAGALRPNVTPHLQRHLAEHYGHAVAPRALMAYCYALLSAPSYTQRFEEELRVPGPRIPLTLDPRVFAHGAALGEWLLALHTYKRVVAGDTGVVQPVGETFPTSWRYEASTQVIHVGDGEIGAVPQTVWDFSVSGYRVLNGWLRHRIMPRRKSPLDAIRPTTWSAVLTLELLQLIWLLEATLAQRGALDDLLDETASGSCVQLPAAEQVQERLGSQRPREDEALAGFAPELLEAVPL
ncbi:MAG: N-6 DNA methylase [Chloroflexi bacterium]|nr:N-6 DNA methylase [Chloroflexota bacterium]MBV9896801.1 N-6 DNA methylase [Chloroflexota bacterium]